MRREALNLSYMRLHVDALWAEPIWFLRSRSLASSVKRVISPRNCRRSFSKSYSNKHFAHIGIREASEGIGE